MAKKKQLTTEINTKQTEPRSRVAFGEVRITDKQSSVSEVRKYHNAVENVRNPKNLKEGEKKKRIRFTDNGTGEYTHFTIKGLFLKWEVWVAGATLSLMAFYIF